MDFIQTCNNFRFSDYVSNFANFENSEKSNRLKYVGGRGDDDSEARALNGNFIHIHIHVCALTTLLLLYTLEYQITNGW